MKPINIALNTYREKNRISFAMPGHKMKDLPNLTDVTELPETIDLHHPNPPVEDSSRWLSTVYGSDKSLYLTGGSTSGIFTLIGSACRPGGLLAAGAGCHQSVLNACTLFGIELVLLPQKIHPVLGVLEPVEPKVLEQAFLDFPEISAVLITSPDYYGRCADVLALSEISHNHGVPLLIDEAHGAHFVVGAPYPPTALSQGADGVVQSAHKTLTALTPAAMVHIKAGRLDPAGVAKTAAMVQTSSPPSYVVASCEQAVEELLENPTPWQQLAEEISQQKSHLTSKTRLVFPSTHDPARIVVNFSAYHTTGTKISELLMKDYGIDVELADLYNIVAIATPSNSKEDIATLFQALLEIAKSLSPSVAKPVLTPMPEKAVRLSPSKAFWGNAGPCSLENACGKTAASAVSAYPPGIPVIYPGQQVTKELIEYIATLKCAGITIAGEQEFSVVSED